MFLHSENELGIFAGGIDYGVEVVDVLRLEILYLLATQGLCQSGLACRHSSYQYYFFDINLIVVTLNCGNDFQSHKDIYEHYFNNYKAIRVLNKGENSFNNIFSNYYIFYSNIWLFHLLSPNIFILY